MTSAVKHRDEQLEDEEVTNIPDLSPLPEVTSQAVDDGEVTYSEELITPEYAAYILDNWNRNPRKLRRDKAAQYAADMAAGNWPTGLDAIGFDKDGWLVNGQHRFAACVMANVPFRTPVARGVTQRAVDNADRGFKRAVADILKDKGEHNVTLLQAALNMCCRWDQANPLSNFVPTWPQLEQYLEDNPDIREAVGKSQVCVRPPLSIRGSVIGPLMFRARRIDAEAADAFLQRVHTGVGLVEDDPVLRLREQFLSRRVTAYGRPSREHDLALAIKCWNAFIVGRPLRQLKWNRGGIRQEPFPYLVGSDGTPWPFPDYLRDQARRQITDIAEQGDDDDDDGDD
jgi:hypothetical protein